MDLFNNLVYRVRVKTFSDPRSAGLLQDAHTLGFAEVTDLEIEDLYFLRGTLTEEEIQTLADTLLSDQIAQKAEWETVSPENEAVAVSPETGIIDVALRPGVTDPVAEQVVRAASQKGINGVQAASTGSRYYVAGTGLTSELLVSLANRLLANPVIHRFEIGQIEPLFLSSATASQHIDRFPIAEMTDDQLMALSQERRAALDLNEMNSIREYCRAENRDLTDVEFEMIAQTWSEHCVHKTFKGLIDVQKPDGTEVIDSLMKTYIRAATEKIAAPWVLSAFKDNAGILEFGDQHEISFKVETHNHPSAIEPFGGANTGVGGVIRDVIGVSAKPIAATDVLCFGNLDQTLEQIPNGVLHPRRIFSGVVGGVQDYGNKIGIPTVNGAILYDPGFTANPLVFCGCVGLAPRGSHPDRAKAGDRVIVLGGRTGRDGLRGATFSSQTMDAQTGEVAGASVQIGAPIVEKGLIDVIEIARDRQIYSAITDCGAGGLSSAVGEMASVLGADVNLDQAPLKYPGLAPWEIWLSEAQERMVLAVPPENCAALTSLCQAYGVEMTDIGPFSGTGRLNIQCGGAVVLDLSMEFLHNGLPRKRFTAVLPEKPVAASPESPAEETNNYVDTLLALLSHPDIASKESVVRIYDHEIQGATVGKPLTGVSDDGPADACILKPTATPGKQAIGLANGINPQYGKVDPYAMAVAVVDEAVRNLAAVGVDPDRIALLDNFCWGDPNDPQTMGSLVEAARGCYDAALQYRAPYISGKDSLNNEYLGVDGFRHAIPPSLLISSIGILDDVDTRVSMDLKEPGNLVYLIGEWRPTFGGSHFAQISADPNVITQAPQVPQPSPLALDVYHALHRSIQRGLVRSAHDLSEGGLAICAAEMCIGGRMGMELYLASDHPTLSLFGETNGCLLVEIKPENQATFEAEFFRLPVQWLGYVNTTGALSVSKDQQPLINCPVSSLVSAWKTTP